MKLPSLLLLPLALSATAQKTVYVEPKTSIAFSAYIDTASGYTFGVALPTTPGTDFIGLITGKGAGWSGVSLGGAMLNKLLIAAWPNGKTGVLASFRKATKYGSPAVATGTFTMTPIADGTYVNATHWSYTFLCSGCILADGTTFTGKETSAGLGFAINTAAPPTAASVTTSFSKHSAQGKFTIDMAAAKSDKYATWAALAVKSVAGRVLMD